jgi:hypothetical protein
MDPHILAHVNTVSSKLKIFVSELISDGYEHILVTYKTMLCMTVL